MSLERLSWKQTRARLRADHTRLVALLGSERADKPGSAYLHPSFICVLLYRISNHFFRSNHKYLARFFWHINVLLTGADISAPVDLGEGLVIMNPCGMSIQANAGRNLTLMPLAGLGSELGRREDIGAGPGLPVLGDDVVVEPHAGVLGPIRIGDRVHINAVTVATKDVPDDAVLEGHPPRFLHRRESS